MNFYQRSNYIIERFEGIEIPEIEIKPGEEILEPGETPEEFNEKLSENIQAEIGKINIDQISIEGVSNETFSSVQESLQSQIGETIKTFDSPTNDSISLNKKATLNEVFQDPNNVETLQNRSLEKLNTETGGNINDATPEQINKASSDALGEITDKINQKFESDLRQLGEQSYQSEPTATDAQNNAARDAAGQAGSEVANNSNEITQAASDPNSSVAEGTSTENITETENNINEEVNSTDSATKEKGEFKQKAWDAIKKYGGQLFGLASKNLMLIALLASLFCADGTKNFCGLNNLLNNIADKLGNAAAKLIDTLGNIINTFLQPIGQELGNIFKKIGIPIIIAISILVFFVLLYLFIRYIIPLFSKKKQQKNK
jgi:hypothetical protein